MAKTHDKHRVKGKESKKRNKSSQFLAHLKVNDAGLVQKQASRSAKTTITTSTSEGNDLVVDEEIIPYDRDVTSSSQIQYRDSSTEEKEVETRNITKVMPYQLQQWMTETSSPNITLGERLEKSKWKYKSAEAQGDLNLGGADEDWGRKPYDWILFSD
ncbi:hypothetical protein NA56DRAFT_644117 [Hyaloscypha hepaticicola]|uniref:Uncharacterized protein n=1 Tax=Hyaloscypha hepaticicola TaxID=2082293 RepID=A0A2J6QAB2_9HELO|nr:hypothetical protein NA56DRAFT_644117 [Hyaloscypha hepaticicola]